MISDLNKHRFEYIWHLYYNKITDKDLSFTEHTPCDPSVWQFPKHLVEWHRLVFGLGHKSLKDKEVLDIGCGMAWYLGNMENIVKKYVGIDPNEESIKYARMMTNIVDMDADVSVMDGQDVTCKADTIISLGVLHQIHPFERVQSILERFDCENVILDCWEQKNGVHVNDIMNYLIENKGFVLTERHQYHYAGKDDAGKNQINEGDRYVLHFDRQAV